MLTREKVASSRDLFVVCCLVFCLLASRIDCSSRIDIFGVVVLPFKTLSVSISTTPLSLSTNLCGRSIHTNQKGNQRHRSNHRHLEVADDPTLSEDAHFVLDVAWPTETTDTVNYVGLADGVGSWRRVGVDPREFRWGGRRLRGGGVHS